ncbi:MAG TPA: diaminopimelate epimerase [Aquificaceae bacterium]|nr:diaminopimelate epimerase [Aquificaceae bacterium]
MEFVKLQGTGNDFVVMDNRDGRVDELIKSIGMSVEEFVSKVCEAHRGVGADGLILIEKALEGGNDFRWRFFNSDGSQAEMCGNGSRCAVRFCYELGIVDEEVRFETKVGVIKAWVLEGGRRVKVRLTPPTDPVPEVVSVEGKEFYGMFINTGVPHFVVPVEDIEDIDVIKLGRAIRFHEKFQPKGTNVNFIKVHRSCIRVRTYERGVESETLACGTGATASAIVAYVKGLVKNVSVDVLTKSGELLRIDFDENLKEVFLEGPVKKVFEGNLSLELFLP